MAKARKGKPDTAKQALRRAIAHLGAGGELTVEDALTLAETAVRSLTATLGDRGAALNGAAARTAKRLSRLKIEIGQLQVNEIRRQRIPQAKSSLREAVMDTESAASRIMECAEAIIEADPSDPKAYQEAVTGHVMAIFEACAFQDLAGQRLGNVADTLERIERRIGRFADALGTKDAQGHFDGEEARQDKRRRDLMLNGPASGGVSQDDIDRMLAGRPVLPRQP